eukprot:GHVS01105132.1.p1 GENE.GHVS01105132.1~~GHVS01105132.1.p1  ORF type:complete len:685 (+),score=148.30 GHVS01105132.1:223-2277(+)
MKTMLAQRAAEVGDQMTYERWYSLCPLSHSCDTTSHDDAAEVGYAVWYKGQQTVLSATRVLAALLTRLRETAEKNKGVAVTDVVIASPGWYTDINRCALLAAARIAGLNCRRIINEYTATALDYGIYRSADFNESEPTRVAFVAMGHQNTSVCIVDFVRGALKVVHEKGDRTLGGRDMDMVMVKRYGEVFKQQTKADALESVKARIKLEEVCRKAKTILSANLEASVSIECLVGESDLSATCTRVEFEEMCEPISERLSSLIDGCIAESGVTLCSIEHVEIAGGCTRIPWVQRTIAKCFKKEISKTLCMDECVARGCTLQAAMCSALYKVREFGVWDKNQHAIEIFTDAIEAVEAAEDTHSNSSEIIEDSATTSSAGGSSCCVLFDAGCFTNTSKYITFYKHQPFDIVVRYKDVDSLPEGTLPEIGRYKVEVPSTAAASPKGHVVKVKAKLNQNGIFAIEKAVVVEEVEVEETVMEKVPLTPTSAEAAEAVVPEEEKTEDNGDVAMSEQPEFKEVPVKRLVKKQKRKEIAVIPTNVGRLTEAQIHQYFEEELSMWNDDRVQQETKEKMNELESYIYEMKHKCSDGILPYTYPTVSKEEFCKKLDDAESWLYDNYEALKSAFVQKLGELKECEPQLPPPPPPPPPPPRPEDNTAVEAGGTTQGGEAGDECCADDCKSSPQQIPVE